MFVALSIALLAKGSNDVTQGTQTLVDTLRLLQPILVTPCTTLIQPLTTCEVDEIQGSLTCLARRCVLAANPEREHGVRTR